MNACLNTDTPSGAASDTRMGRSGRLRHLHRRTSVLAAVALTFGLTLGPLTAHAQEDAAETPTPPPAPVAPAAPPAPMPPPPRPPEDLAERAALAAEQARIDIDTGFATVLMKRERVVKGAPYCAQALHETVQPLADGNRIVHKQSSQLCRDGEGRTRQEVDRQGRRLVYLRDPVSGENWLLDPERKTARFLGGRVEDNARREEAERQRDYAERQKDYAERMRDYAARMREWAREHAQAWREGANPRPDPQAAPQPEPRPDPKAAPAPAAKPVPPPPPPRAVVIAPSVDRQEVRVIQIGTPDGIDSPIPPIPAAVGFSAERFTAVTGKAQVETLPARELGGLKVTGQRLTSTIEPGKIGNEKPIVITAEIWTSPELQLTVSSVKKDPRSGDQNYQLQDIRRGEPDGALMKVPADYRRTGEPKARKG
ncbi:hypothetical protein SAMN05216359_11649 [Roseateles sp. YR242]|uniref:hypothetical protein n=1 Tax=Roseateles sp. YR242 TaxID=1855305 RepID=UPI0008C8E6A2|nr:hypothetical protein [Roseateles sp. YR242]SEL76676.1 hypothetical protein SAMN05216359_11649 [Roseateles sp. YR242]